VSGTVEVTATDVVAIELAPPVPALPIYGSAGLQARARYADGTTAEFTSAVLFVTADRQVASMAARALMNGMVDDTSLRRRPPPGKTVVETEFQGVKGSTPVDVTSTVAVVTIAPDPADWSHLVSDNWLLSPAVDVRRAISSSGSRTDLEPQPHGDPHCRMTPAILRCTAPVRERWRWSCTIGD
jgi:hypothetical protein